MKNLSQLENILELAQTALGRAGVQDFNEEKDACYRKIMKSYGKWSARAAQATAKCRKEKGDVRKTKSGTSLRRWEKEKWKDTRTGEACGAGKKNEYCRPTRKISKKDTAKTAGELGPKLLKKKKAEKSKVGMQGASGKKVSKA